MTEGLEGYFSEPNTILEINEAHADNFYLVIPSLPSAIFVGSVFNMLTQPQNIITPSTSAVSITGGDCDAVLQNKLQSRREQNLDHDNFKLYISDVELPNNNIVAYDVPTHFSTLSRAGKMTFTELKTTMMVSETLQNYKIIQYWMYAIFNPQQPNKTSGRKMIEKYFVDVYLIITNNMREKVAEYKFLDAFPKDLPALPFSYKTADKLNIAVTWAHSGMFPSNNFVLRYV